MAGRAKVSKKLTGKAQKKTVVKAPKSKQVKKSDQRPAKKSASKNDKKKAVAKKVIVKKPVPKRLAPSPVKKTPVKQALALVKKITPPPSKPKLKANPTVIAKPKVLTMLSKPALVAVGKKKPAPKPEPKQVEKPVVEEAPKPEPVVKKEENTGLRRGRGFGKPRAENPLDKQKKPLRPPSRDRKSLSLGVPEPVPIRRSSEPAQPVVEGTIAPRRVNQEVPRSLPVAGQFSTDKLQQQHHERPMPVGKKRLEEDTPPPAEDYTPPEYLTAAFKVVPQIISIVDDDDEFDGDNEDFEDDI